MNALERRPDRVPARSVPTALAAITAATAVTLVMGAPPVEKPEQHEAPPPVVRTLSLDEAGEMFGQISRRHAQSDRPESCFLEFTEGSAVYTLRCAP